MPSGPDGFGAAIEDFVGHLKLERGLSSNSLMAYRSDLVELAEFLGGKKPPDRVAMADINQFFAQLVSLGRRPSTLARKVSSVRHFFAYLVERGLMPENPAVAYRAPRISRYHPDYLSVTEIEKIINTASRGAKEPERDTAIVEILYGCGLRISELANLKTTDIEFEAGFLRVLGKGDKQRLVPLGKFARDAIQRYLDSSSKGRRGDGNLVFVNRQGRRISRVGLWKIIKRLVSKAGITKQVTPHTFRHSFATHLIEGGADLRTVQEMLGHADISTTEIYTRIDRDYIIAEHRKYHPRELAGFRRPSTGG